ncbi:PREDICTED: general odorant-binding protein 83a-like [Vollenhovia emeryi]|uniref:general odorant-binding protein 83a-like n=1 Tax=Vollenhovia emeryi TaxID=411798 RepID=UPI0005F40111|nr:PREDICTED: general odorant-binding protein 83a-like [Vollenhovia emeryi]
MKITNILLVTLSLLLVRAQADIKRECRRQTNVSWASLKLLKAGNIEQNDMKLKCYLRCFMIKSGILNENNNVDVEKALRHLPRSMQESSKNILNRCKSIQAENPCDKAFQIATCYVRAQPDILKSVSFI